MKTSTNNAMKTGAKHLFVILVLLFSGHMLMAQQVDLGIFPSGNPNEMEIRMRPDFEIQPTDLMSNIVFTIRYPDGLGITIDPSSPFPYELELGHGDVDGGFFYQTFDADHSNLFGATISPGDQVVILTFEYTNAVADDFELTNEADFPGEDTDYYFEINALDRTGIFYTLITPPVPLSNLGLYLGVLLLVVFFVVRARRLI